MLTVHSHCSSAYFAMANIVDTYSVNSDEIDPAWYSIRVPNGQGPSTLMSGIPTPRMMRAVSTEIAVCILVARVVQVPLLISRLGHPGSCSVLAVDNSGLYPQGVHELRQWIKIESQDPSSELPDAQRVDRTVYQPFLVSRI